MSSLLWLAGAISVAAHEVTPAVGDLTVEGQSARLELRLNLEAFIAGIDLDSIENTNETEKSGAYDALRALPPAQLRERLDQAWPRIRDGIALYADGQPVPLALAGARIPEVGNAELPRASTLTLQGSLPEGARNVTLTWAEGFGTLILRQMGVEDGFTGYLSGGQTSPEIPLSGGGARSGWAAFAQYVPVGFDHILPLGLDHILFVLGLFFLSTRLGPLLWQVTAFTLAHTVTLALAALKIVTVPASIVEPLIAASIVFVAVENILARGLTAWRPVVVFVFGLLHGLGFASVLAEFGLPADRFVPALIGFNVGVELGQLTVIAVAFLIVFMAVQADRQRGDLRVAQVAYGALTLAAIAAAVWSGWRPAAPLQMTDLSVFALPIAGLFLLSLLAVVYCDQLNAYRRYVAMPASGVIALVGAWWFIERTLL
ncbi:HupE/UreJ family protein [Roseovarius salinarum]|uniref:HupE/UreJ family protein n=1 Tax=Roseovarius salinarum TaxID=1981892 RepID=UPI000C3229A8|nr:HupE/UreJ family protein [Roseovarius salinarum]